jgi:membrane-bound serine protease (ClpP class)
MRRVASLFALLTMLAGTGAAVAQDAAAAPPVEVVKVEGTLDGTLLAYLDERLDDAEQRGATVVLQLDSPGAMGEDPVGVADRIARSSVPVIVWVGTVPARASGAGLLLLYASSLASVAPGSQTGPLRPVDVLHTDREPAGLDATIDGWLAARGRSVDRTHEGEALNAEQAIAYGFAEVAAASVPDLLNDVDGRVVPTAAGPVTLRTAIATEGEITFTEPGPLERVRHAVASPSMILFLLVFGIACLAFELTQPGFGFAGFAGVFLVALAVLGMWDAPPDPLGAVLLLGGVGLLIADVVLRRLAVLTAIGMVLLLAGSLLLYGGVADAIRISPWLIGLVLVGSFLYYGFGLTVAMQSRDRILETQKGLVGLVGEARGRLAPDGPVHVKGAMWRGRSVGEPIAQGAKVRVRGVDGLILRVEAEPETAPAGDGPVTIP